LYFILKESRFGLEYLLERAKEKEIQFETDQGKLLFAANLLDLSKLDLPLRIIKPVAAKDMRTSLIAQSEELFRRMRPRGLC
jgi:hypothetical protein